jgi:hypothetical protein
MKTRKRTRRRTPDVIPLNDLTPRKNPKGGSGVSPKMVFGERPIPNEQEKEKAGDGRATGVMPRREKERK